MGSRRLPVLLCALFLASMAPLMPVTADDVPAWPNHVVISEILVSPNNLVSNATSDNVYGAVDWNGDGDYGKYSDQFIELWNPTDQVVNISNWVLDDHANGGSPACSIGWNTELAPDARMAFFRDNTDIELDYYDGDTVNLQDDQGTLVHSMSYPAEDSWYGVPYTLLEDGTYWKDFDGPSPGTDEQANWTGPNAGGTCFTVSDTPLADEYILTGRIVTMTSEGAFFDGGVLIKDGKITSVWSGSTIPSAHSGIAVTETDGTIYPGLIDLHNHMHYNHIPLWDFDVHLSPAQQSDEGGYTNRYQWGNNWDYGPSITWMKGNIQSNSRWGMASQQMKYAEVQAVAGGVTAVQGSPSSGTDAWDSMLSRNVELYNFGQDGMSTCAVCGAADDDYTGSHLISQNSSGSLNAWFVHLAEGVDSSSRAEFDSLYEKGLIMDETVAIHGTALTGSQFAQMADKGGGLVWSPLSNLLLYGNTTDVRAADNAGVTISLAPDWGPSGSKSNLHELKVADLWNRDVMDGYFSDFELAEMVTSNPAEISNWDAFVGEIKVGMYADLVVLDTFHENPYRNLIESIDRDVRLTIVQGKAVFGDVDLMTSLQGDDWEYIYGNGFSKAIDVTSVSETDGLDSWDSIESGLAMAMRNEVGDIREHWSEVSDLNTDEEVQDYLDASFDGDYNDGVSHLKNLTLDPIFTMNDERYFDVINRSTHANFHVDLSKLYDYYDVTYDADSNRPFVEDSNFTPEPVACPEDLCWDGSSRDPVDCSCPEEPEPETEPSVNLKVTPGDYTITGELADVEGNWTVVATANQIIIYVDGVENKRLSIDSSNNQYSYESSGVTRILELHSYDGQNKSYTGVDWGGATITLTSTDQADSGGDDVEQNAASDSKMLYNVGIIAAIIVILLSGAAIFSMMGTTTTKFRDRASNSSSEPLTRDDDRIGEPD